MDISKVFLKQAHLFLNSSLLVLFPSTIYIVIIMLVFSEKFLMVLVIPFLVYSLYLFHNYLLNYRRFINASRKIATFKKDELDDFFTCQQFIICFAREERELLFFHSNGQLLGKMIERSSIRTYHLKSNKLPKEFILMDNQERELATYLEKNGIIDVYQADNGYIGGYSYVNERDFHTLVGETVGTLKSKITFMDDQIEDINGNLVFRILKGWMPVKYQELFINPNRPILTISPNVTEINRIIFLSYFVKRFFH